MTLQILFIDDEAQCIELAAVGLYADFPGCKITQAWNCEEGMKLLESGSFDVAVVDQKLPMISGLECLKLIRLRWKQLPILIITGHIHRVDFEKECIQAGADEYVSKSSMRELMGRRVEAAINLRKKRLAIEEDVEYRKGVLQGILNKTESSSGGSTD